MKRESFGLQIALIICVLLIIALGGATGAYFKMYYDLVEEHETLQASQTSLTQARDTARYARKSLEFMLGKEGVTDADRQTLVSYADEDIKAMEEQYEADMQIFGNAWPEGDRNYRKLVEPLLATIQERNQELAAAKSQLALIEQEKLDVETRERARATSAETARDSFKKDLDNQTAKLTGDYTTLAGTQTKLNQDLDKLRTEMTKIQDESAVQLAAANQEIQKKEQEIIQLRQKLDGIIVENFDTPDGQITWANPSGDTVWINLGIADGLRRQTTFSVYDGNETNFARAEAKGSIEITRVIDQHLAEARVLDSEIANPLVANDVIYSPTWQPGRKVHFAMIGFLDVDGDGKDDQQLVHNLITMNNGVVDLEINDKGEIDGKMTIDTRYLVVGARPTEDTSANYLAKYNKVIVDAENLSIEKISLEKLLSYMGYRGGERTVGLGRGADRNDFSPKSSDGGTRTSTGDVSDAFRERRPPRRN